jgi:hypothetical protein
MKAYHQFLVKQHFLQMQEDSPVTVASLSIHLLLRCFGARLFVIVLTSRLHSCSFSPPFGIAWPVHCFWWTTAQEKAVFLLLVWNLIRRSRERVSIRLLVMQLRWLLAANNRSTTSPKRSRYLGAQFFTILYNDIASSSSAPTCRNQWAIY